VSTRAAMVKLLASPAAITSSRDRLLCASPLAPRRLVKSLQALGDALLRRFVWGSWSDAERVAGCQPLDLVAFSNCELIGECLGNGHLQLTRDFGHNLLYHGIESYIFRAMAVRVSGMSCVHFSRCDTLRCSAWMPQFPRAQG